MLYRHLLVPVDESTLSADNVNEAVRLAAAWQARITFFYATPDYAATQDGALLRSAAPQDFSQVAIGETHALLQKARASAAAAGVPCEMASKVCDRPAQAIVETAGASGCDLIVMASHGLRGLPSWLRKSHTEQVLRQSPVPLLVTRVESTQPLSDRERALAVILDEHRSIACVIRGMQELVRESRESKVPLDLLSLKGMLTYMRDFPLALHHPKEEKYLHRLLRERHPGCETLLLELEQQHEREHQLVATASARLLEAQSGAAAAQAELGTLVDTIADAVWRHLRLEEDKLLPIAEAHLHDGDWTEMAAAFEANDDPGFGALPATEFRRLFTRIANLMAAPRH